jgi:ABC-2 type transport system permease protein
MRLVVHHAWLEIRLFFRSPTFVISVAGYPAILFAFIGLPFAGTSPAANLEVSSFVAFSGLSITLFMLGSSVARSRSTYWERWLRTLPLAPGQKLAGRVLAALPFAFVSAAAVIAIARVTSPVDVSSRGWVLLVLTFAAGFVLFAALALTLAYWLPPLNAPPLIAIAFLMLTYTGNFWTSTQPLPHSLAAIATYSPSAQWHRLLAAATESASVPTSSIVWLAGYTAVFVVLARAGIRRDEAGISWTA